MELVYKRIIKYSTIFLLCLITALFIGVLVFYSELKTQILSLIATYGFIGLFFIVFFLELLFQPIAADLPIIAMILAKANVYVVLITVLVAAYAATITNYVLGRVYGEVGLKRVLKEKTYDKWHGMYKKYGKLALILAAITPVPYAPMCWIVGMFKMKKLEFFTYGLLPRTIRYLVDGYLALLILGI